MEVSCTADQLLDIRSIWKMGCLSFRRGREGSILPSSHGGGKIYVEMRLTVVVANSV